MNLATNRDRNGLVNLVGELEQRLTSRSSAPGLDPDLARAIPDGSSYLLALFDGLGDNQLSGEAAAPLQADRRFGLRAPFPTTTTVSMATIATGTTPAEHGLIAHLMWFAELNLVVNTLKWVDLTGAAVAYDTGALLPAPNLWERLGMAGVEPVTVQPEGFVDTPLSKALYRGCRWVGVATREELVARALEEVAVPRRFVFAYWPPVDFAAHVFGMQSIEYSEALREVADIWRGLAKAVPPGAVLLGTADHGMASIAEAGKLVIRDAEFRMLDCFGDPRAVMIRGSSRLVGELTRRTGGELVGPDQFLPWLGASKPHPRLTERLPMHVLLARPGTVILPPGFDRRLVGYHGGLTDEEVAIPLLVAAG
jgi:hypothetical protein